VEVDKFGRPLAYWVREYHPNEVRTKIDARSQRIERVPADQIFHLKITDRWPQTRGEPWLHAAVNRLNQLGEFEESAVINARIGASKVGFFENPEGDIGIADGAEASGTPSMTVEAGEFTQLPPGYKFSSWDPAYPNDAFDPFTRACLRGIAAGVGVSYESLSRDYSQSNYSSSRLALIDDRDLWRTLQSWWIRSFREPLHREWMQAAVLAGVVPVRVEDYSLNRARYEAVRFKPRGWSWVDPTKEVNAYKEAVKAGFTTVSDVIAATGGGLDLEDVLEQRRVELDMMKAHDLTFDTDPASFDEVGRPLDEGKPDDAPEGKKPEDDDDETPARLYAFKRDYP
jgi:lambda family phage portal protein